MIRPHQTGTTPACPFRQAAFFALAVGALLTTAASPTDPVPERVPAPPVGTGTVTGVVTWAEDGSPAAGAPVSVQDPRTGGTARHDGRYTLFEIPAGTRVIVARPPEGEGKVSAVVEVIADETLTLDLEIP
jgi:hypothetical protein